MFLGFPRILPTHLSLGKRITKKKILRCSDCYFGHLCFVEFCITKCIVDLGTHDEDCVFYIEQQTPLELKGSHKYFIFYFVTNFYLIYVI